MILKQLQSWEQGNYPESYTPDKNLLDPWHLGIFIILFLFFIEFQKVIFVQKEEIFCLLFLYVYKCQFSYSRN